MVTIQDIAEKLNVSKGTVSKALNGAADVSETLRKSILETAVEMGYSRTLHKRDAKTLCIFIENMSCQEPNDFGYDIVVGFRKAAEPSGYLVEVVPLDDKTQKHARYDEYMLKHNYAGALFLGLSLSDVWLHDLQTAHTPAVLLDNYIKANPYTCYMGVDNAEGMDLAVAHLRSLGHTRIGYLSGGLGSYVNQARYSAFFHALRKNDLPDDPHLAGSDYFFSECLQKHLPTLLKQNVTAILCSHDLLAHTVMLHCLELGIRIPQDLSIIGFDDLPLCHPPGPHPAGQKRFLCPFQPVGRGTHQHPAASRPVDFAPVHRRPPGISPAPDGPGLTPLWQAAARPAAPYLPKNVKKPPRRHAPQGLSVCMGSIWEHRPRRFRRGGGVQRRACRHRFRWAGFIIRQIPCSSRP